MRRIVVVILATLWLANGQTAADGVKFDALVVQTTYTDLFSLICRDFTVIAEGESAGNGQGSDCMAHRMIGGGKPRDWGEGTFGNLSVLHATNLAPNQLLVSFEVPSYSQAIGVALLQLLPKPKLLDLFEIEGTPDCKPSLSKELPLAGGAEALLFYSAHVGIGFAYQNETIVSLRNGRFAPVVSVGVTSCSRCDGGGDREEGFEATNPGGVLHLRFTVKKRTTQVFAATFDWDAVSKRYRPNSNATGNIWR